MLKLYPFIIETLRVLAPFAREIAKHDADLARQMRRAASSIALNVAEACSASAGNERARQLTALGSTRETRACLEVGDAFGYVAVDAVAVDRLDRIAATLFKLTRLK